MPAIAAHALQLEEDVNLKRLLQDTPAGSGTPAPGTPAAAAAAAAGGSNAAVPQVAPISSARVRYSQRKGLFTIEDDCDHATWLTQCVHFDPSEWSPACAAVGHIQLLAVDL